jgi:hypothetical protein
MLPIADLMCGEFVCHEVWGEKTIHEVIGQAWGKTVSGRV